MRAITWVLVIVAIVMSVTMMVSTWRVEKSYAEKDLPIYATSFTPEANAWAEEHCEIVSRDDGLSSYVGVSCRIDL